MRSSRGEVILEGREEGEAGAGAGAGREASDDAGGGAGASSAMGTDGEGAAANGDGSAGASTSSGGSGFISTSFSHFQVADALLCDCYDGTNDELLLTKSKTLVLYVVPRDGKTARREASLHLGISPYTMARSSDGECIAVGGNCQVFLITYNRREKTLRYASVIVFHASNSSDWPMANAVRFGRLGGKERLLVTNQNGSIYVFEVPRREEVEECLDEGRDASPLFMCTSFYDLPASLGQEGADRLAKLSKKVSVAPVETWVEGLRNLQSFELSRSLGAIARQQYATNVIGSFPIALNCAVPSPDGKWIAVVGDSPVVFICPADKVIEGRPVGLQDDPVSLPERFIRLKLPATEEVRRPFSQYCNWNASSTLVAASSDNGRYVCVWQTSNWTLVKMFDSSPRPCLPLAFADNLDSVLLWAEDIAGSVNVANTNVHSKKKDHALLKLPERISKKKREHFTRTINNLSSAHREVLQGQRCCGIGCSRGFVYVATTELISRHKLVTEWTPALHPRFNRKYRAAVREVLRGSSSAESHLARLPSGVLMRILAHAAFPTENWVNAPTPPSHSSVPPSEQ